MAAAVRSAAALSDALALVAAEIVAPKEAPENGDGLDDAEEVSVVLPLEEARYVIEAVGVAEPLVEGVGFSGEALSQTLLLTDAQPERVYNRVLAATSLAEEDGETLEEELVVAQPDVEPPAAAGEVLGVPLPAALCVAKALSVGTPEVVPLPESTALSEAAPLALPNTAVVEDGGAEPGSDWVA